MQKDLDAIAKRIIELQVEHRDLDDVIARLSGVPGPDELQIRRLKKRKLQIKDQITWLQIQLTPDIPA
ncbi:MAG TPA: YdcH family protein [Burkholderiaceae bacterium]|nr:YdcH family protein [Burkholderiaceae bacterium]